ncbi:phage integrase SAM-like domain-containing protein [Mucilaginibacter sp. Bleaf8]|uniref:phage integrase SAM-like domain-containing protein n=1 Tax=Mucilaginibacter sp. Bleaf8 TaxID=2834430 RepID=UPI001BCA852D|nr:phage integrase SAM-like domain-containing protein [Mucilaginibacter sp. Bleaf8]MBS7565352.1 phage integrase SAM-like domain-containing protein [Mucilaginibacter sp. Bleaf8]
MKITPKKAEKMKVMKAMNTFGVQIILRMDKSKNEKAPIYARITINGEIIHFAVKQWIDPKYWDQRKGAGKGNKDDVKIINGGLDQIRLSLGSCYRQILLKGKQVTASAVKDAFFSNDGDVPNTLSRLFEYHNEQATQTSAWSTLKHYYVTQRYLQKFIEAKLRKRSILLQEINYKFIIDFERFGISLQVTVWLFL